MEPSNHFCDVTAFQSSLVSNPERLLSEPTVLSCTHSFGDSFVNACRVPGGIVRTGDPAVRETRDPLPCEGYLTARASGL